MRNLPGVLRASPQPSADGEAAWARHVAEIESNVSAQQERHLAERFARAMELLGNEKPEVRWGGIFALERLARRSPQDQSSIAEVLATYVRRRAPWKPGEPTQHIESETQLIVTVLGRRSWPYRNEDRPLDLHATNLAKAHLPLAHLEAAFFYDCNLESALLYQAHLQGAWMARCHLKNANLDGAHLEGADLSTATGLSADQLQMAYLDAKTMLPASLSLKLQPRRY